MSDLATPVGILAAAGAAVALISLVVAVTLAMRLRRVRAAQQTVLAGRSQDLVAHAAALQQDFDALRAAMESTASELNGRLATAEGRLDGAIAYRALVRYDAYNEMSGRQSTSIALLDASRSGVVLSSIHHRDQARLYAKRVSRGEGELELSPEEAEAVRLALADGDPERSA